MTRIVFAGIIPRMKCLTFILIAVSFAACGDSPHTDAGIDAVDAASFDATPVFDAPSSIDAGSVD